VVRAAGALLIALLVAAGLGCGGGDGGSSREMPAARTTAAAASPGGPQAEIDPRGGPPGTRVTVKGSGWSPSVRIDLFAANSSGEAYATATTESDGSFVLSFTLEKAPDGADLPVGRFDLEARSASTGVTLPFQVEVRRPVRGPESGG
jgi:hypothetical protein